MGSNQPLCGWAKVGQDGSIVARCASPRDHEGHCSLRPADDLAVRVGVDGIAGPLPSKPNPFTGVEPAGAAARHAKAMLNRDAESDRDTILSGGDPLTDLDYAREVTAGELRELLGDRDLTVGQTPGDKEPEHACWAGAGHLFGTKLRSLPEGRLAVIAYGPTGIDALEALIVLLLKERA